MKSDFINELGILFNQNNSISDDDYNKLNVKRGLRNKNGTGVLVGLTKIGSVQGYTVDKKGKKIPKEGKLYYRGIAIDKLIKQFGKEKSFSFESLAKWFSIDSFLSSKRIPKISTSFMSS